MAEEKQKHDYDYCMVLPAKDSKLNEKCQDIVDRIVRAGFKTHIYFSIQKDEVLVLIGCEMRKLEAFADLIDYRMLLDAEALERHAKQGDQEKGIPPVEIAHNPDVTVLSPYASIHGKYDTDETLQDLYWRPPGMDHPFRDIVRLKLINLMLQAPANEGGCGLALRKLVVKKTILAFYPLHDYEKLNTLYDRIMDWWTMPWNTPMFDIKEYFGEKIGLYFTFLAHLTTWCMWPMFVGLAIQIHVVIENNRSVVSVPAFAIFISFWAVLMLEYWKRKEKTTALNWGMIGFEDEEKDRPEFFGESMKSFINGKEVLYFPAGKKVFLLSQSFLVIASMVCLVVGCVVGIYMARFAIEKLDKNAASPVASILNAIQIQFCNFVFGAIAEKLTDRENHRTDTQYEDSLIAKLFAFQFVNSFSSFTYIAFIQHAIEGEASQPVMDVLALNLTIIFGSRLLTGNIFEVLLPVFLAKRKYAKETEGTDGNLSPPEEEYIRAPYDIIKGPLKDYAELAVQFGFVTLFVVALPAAPFLAFISNYVEIRTDGYKLVKHHQRPVPTGAEDIGTWQTIFTLVAGAAVVSNAGLTFFTMTTFDYLPILSRVWLFIGFQYVVLSIMYVFAVLVPDEPEEVAIQMQRQTYLVEKVINKIADEDDTELLRELSLADVGMVKFEIEDSYS